MTGRPESPFRRRNVVSLVNLDFDDIPPCQVGRRPGTSVRRSLYENVTDTGQYAAKSSLAEGQNSAHGVRK